MSTFSWTSPLKGGYTSLPKLVKKNFRWKSPIRVRIRRKWRIFGYFNAEHHQMPLKMSFWSKNGIFSIFHAKLNFAVGNEFLSFGIARPLVRKLSIYILREKYVPVSSRLISLPKNVFFFEKSWFLHISKRHTFSRFPSYMSALWFYFDARGSGKRFYPVYFTIWLLILETVS